jgi:hypothetical protein
MRVDAALLATKDGVGPGGDGRAECIEHQPPVPRGESWGDDGEGVPACPEHVGRSAAEQPSEGSLVENVLPHVLYRQWTLSFPHRVRWVLLKEVGLLSDVLTVFLRAVFAQQCRRARRQSLRGGQTGAVSFIQFFGSALQVTPHSHALVPDGVFVPGEHLLLGLFRLAACIDRGT